jgi:hypothetical protein
MNDFEIAKQVFDLFEKLASDRRTRILTWVTEALGGHKQKTVVPAPTTFHQVKPRRKYRKRRRNPTPTPRHNDSVRYVVTQVVLDYYRDHPSSTVNELRDYAAKVYPDMPNARTSLPSCAHSLWKRGYLTRTGISGEYRYSIAEGGNNG